MIKKRTKLSIFYCITILMYIIGDGLFGFGFTAFMYSKGLSMGQIGILFGVTNLFLAFFDYPSGNISDKYGRKKVAAIGFIFFGIGLIFFGLANSFFIFLFSGLIRAIGIAFISGSPIAWYLDELNKIGEFKHKDKSLPIIRTLGFLFGSLSGILAGGLSTFSISMPIFVGGSMLIFMGLILFILFKDNYGESEALNFQEFLINNTINFIKDKNMNLISIYELFNSVTFTVFILAWQVYALQVIGLEYKYLGFMYTLVMLCMTFSSLLTRGLIEKFKTEMITVSGILVATLGLIVISVSREKVLFLIAFIVFELGFGLSSSSYNTWIHDYIPSSGRTSYLSALNTIQSLISFFISLILGFLLDKLGFTGGWIFAVVFQLLCIPVLIKFKNKNIIRD
jgi:MFS family permease